MSRNGLLQNITGYKKNDWRNLDNADMKQNTRFNPTVNGPLHIGHLYTIMVNYGEARASGGKFGIRFDDTQWSWNYMLGPEKVKEFMVGMLNDLEWLGISLDFIDFQSEMMPKVEAMLRDVFDYEPDQEHYASPLPADVPGSPHHFYPYTDRLTCEKVIMDMLEATTWLIRGMDLITEDCLYKFFCDKFLLYPPRTTYIPRLSCGQEISKTEGKYRIDQFRQAGIQPDDLLSCLAHDCLSEEGWRVEHIRIVPTLGPWAEEAMSGLPA